MWRCNWRCHTVVSRVRADGCTGKARRRAVSNGLSRAGGTDWQSWGEGSMYSAIQVGEGVKLGQPFASLRLSDAGQDGNGKRRAVN